ncbi:dicarboxylate/amino acid:cation symporter [Tissierella carlieri]|uniref:dicarboxylate/amino acid:cation symporter n=1 Tax=Tissierella carlieri TaxID=689904 RepID=UPI001C10AFC5|nr:dicarboxylate/amino acid:cation symporter [Tissierella carlieri]MBU5310972.1 dicarboxylate/amino acid:cation symporter [Tissierella carlieri]
MKVKKISLAVQIMIAMVLGSVCGLVFGPIMTNFGFIGTIWLNSLKMIIVPLVLIVLVTGITSQKDLKSLGRIAISIIVFYIISMLLATSVAVITTSTIKPGLIASITGLETKEVTAGSMEMTLSGFALSLFSDNMFATFTSGNIIQTVVIAAIIGIAILLTKDQEKQDNLIALFQNLESLVNSIIGLIMKASPIGVFFLMADSLGKYGASIFSGIAALVGTFYLACFIYILLGYGSFLYFGVGINPFKFIKDSAELWIYTISTCSSVAAIPITMRVAKEKFGVPEKVSSFTIPLGSQVSNDGSVVLYGCVILFIIQMNGIPMGLGELVRIIFLATIFSLGGQGLPGSGIIKVLVLVSAFGFPTELVGVIAAFYRLFDMGITTLNCMSDLVGTVLVSKREEKRERRILQSRQF